MKWTVIVKSSDDLVVFTRCIAKLVTAIDPRRTEIIVMGDDKSGVFSSVLHTYCSPKKFDYKWMGRTGPVDIDPVEGVPTDPTLNDAMRQATGDYICILRDTSMVPKNFLTKLTFCADNHVKVNRLGPVAIVGPITNIATRTQGLEVTGNQPIEVDQVQKKLDQQLQGRNPWSITGVLEDFCVLIRKEAFAEVGAFDLLLKDDAWLSNWIDRARQYGWYAVATGDTYVYREDAPRQVVDWEGMYETHVSVPQSLEKLAVLYRIKINDEFERDIFIKSLKKSLEFADGIFILDDNSKYRMGLFMKENYPDLWLHQSVKHYEKFSRPFDEKRDRNQLIEWAEKDGFTWALAIDGDEIVEDKVTRGLLDKFIHPVNSAVQAYALHEYYFWDNETEWRMDGVWGEAHDVRLARLNIGSRISLEGVLSAHTGVLPTFPTENIRITSLRIKSYALMTARQRKEKRALYEKADRREQGVSNYAYLEDAQRMVKFPWKEDSTISVYTPMSRLGPVVYEWLDAVVPFADEAVLGIDGLSSVQEDQLTDVWGAKVVPVWGKGNPEDFKEHGFGASRNAILKHCDMQWILQLDADERVKEWGKIRRMADVPLFEAWAFQIQNFQKDGQGSIPTTTTRLFRNKDGVEYWGILHETIDNFIKKAGWKISQAPTQLLHYGYLLQTEDESWKKMQSYIELNIRQIKEVPNDPRAYYNLALHLIEDQMIDDGLRLLQIACNYSAFHLPWIECGKMYLTKARGCFQVALRVLQEKIFL